jgi:hypothetical protein
MKIYIKNMVCQGTKLIVLLELKKLGFNYNTFELGEIDFEKDLSLREIRKLDQSLHKYGLELSYRNILLVSEIRHAILDLVENNITPGTSFSYYISHMVGKNYTYLNRYFIKETGITIEEYYIEKKNERVKLNEPTWSNLLNPLGKSA